jgi:hypothetical protein
MLIRLKANIPEILIGALLTVAVFAIGMTFEASCHPPQQQPGANADKENASHPPESALWNWLTHDASGFFTLWLAIVGGGQIGLFYWQLRYMRQGMEDAKLVATATDRNTRAAIALKLPLIKASLASLSHGTHSEDTGQRENCAVHFVEVVNGGETRAFPREILYGWTVGNNLPERATYQFLDRYALGTIVEPNSTTPTRIYLTMDCPLLPGQWSQICRGNFLWFYVDLIYDDFMGETRHQSSCWRWSYIGDGFGWRADETPAYNRKT